MSPNTDEQDRLFQSALTVAVGAVLEAVRNPNAPDYAVLRAWPAQFPGRDAMRAGLLEVLVADYAEFLRAAYGPETANEILVAKLGTLEALSLEREVFGRHAALDGWV